MNTWRKLIVEAMTCKPRGFGPQIFSPESWEDVVSCTLTVPELDKEFDDGFGGSKGKPFTLWTKSRVYFPVVYDGAEWVGSVPRNPCDEASPHWGGE